jgi:hypothetical protein
MTDDHHGRTVGRANPAGQGPWTTFSARTGMPIIPGAFKTFGDLFRRLPADVQAEWHEELRREWMIQEEASTLLLPWLEELY